MRRLHPPSPALPRRLAPLLLLLPLAALAAAGCRRHLAERADGEFLALGGIPIRVSAWQVDPEAFSRTVEEFRREVQALEAELSTHRTESAVSRLNRGDGVPVPVDAVAFEVLEDAVAAVAETGGAFDPTVMPLLQVWKAAAERGTPPTADELAEARARVGISGLHLAGDRRHGGTARLDPGAAIDLGGIAKGSFADLGLARLRARGVRRALVELGGDLAAYDVNDPPSPFRIGVRDPDDPNGFLGVLLIDGGSVVTSGDYERGYAVAGRRVNHIIDPRTGLPVEGLRAVTLLAPSGSRADALATAVMVMGAEEGYAFVERTPDVEAILVARDPAAPAGHRIRVSPGLRDRFVPDPRWAPSVVDPP